MLKTLKIKNVALTKEATIEFDEKLNIISGETGAGKSVLLDAIGLILGHKADKTLIKSGEEFLKVEATFNIFDNKKVEQFFLENDLEFDNCIIISRKVSQDGKNEVKLNGESVPLAYIKTLGKLLVDVHGQNDNNQILDRQNQLLLIDKFIDFDFNALKENYKKIVEINKKIKELSFDDDTRTRELDLLSYQISEIENANITENEEDDLKSELLLMKNAEKIANNLNSIKESFEGQFGILSGLRKAGIDLSNIFSLSENQTNLLERFNSLEIEAGDVYDEILKQFNVEFSQERYDEIDQRLEVYKNLHKKYGLMVADILKFLEEAKLKRDKLLNFEEELDALNKQKKNLISEMFSCCEKLTKQRKECAENLSKKLVYELKELMMPNAKIVFSFNEYNKENFEQFLSASGADVVDLMFSANLGEDVKPLNLVASGGEISRLVLAIKTIDSSKNDTPTIIFDELDTGISGEASVQTSKKLAKISQNVQILAVSHQFQICAMADKNILVKKFEMEGKTYSQIFSLSGEETVLELCRFLSVNGVTESTIIHAKEVKAFCDEYKKSLTKNC